MDAKAVAEKLLARVGETKAEFLKLKDEETKYIGDLLKNVKDDVLSCEAEDDLIKVCSELVDLLYTDNALTEAIDGPAAFFLLKGADKFILDKFFGADWFLKFKAWVASL